MFTFVQSDCIIRVFNVLCIIRVSLQNIYDHIIQIFIYLLIEIMIMA